MRKLKRHLKTPDDLCCMCDAPADYVDEHTGHLYCESCKKAKEKK